MFSGIICAIVGVVLASAGVSVLSSWQAWVILVLVAVNGAVVARK